MCLEKKLKTHEHTHTQTRDTQQQKHTYLYKFIYNRKFENWCKKLTGARFNNKQ